MTVFETTGHVALRVSLVGGAVEIETTEQPRVEIELVPLRDNEATRNAIAGARVEMIERGAGHEIIVSLGRGAGFGTAIGRGSKVGVRVRCPRGSDLDLRASSADLGAVGPLGVVTVKTTHGDVLLEDAVTLEVSTASGDVRARDVEQELSLRTASGDATVRRSGGLLSANLVSGDLSVGEAAAGLSVATVSGDVRVHAAGGGSMRIQAVSGDVHLAIKPGEHLYIDARSVSGTMSSELGVEDAPPNPASHFHELSVSTVSGDVQIARAVVVGA